MEFVTAVYASSIECETVHRRDLTPANRFYESLSGGLPTDAITARTGMRAGYKPGLSRVSACPTVESNAFDRAARLIGSGVPRSGYSHDRRQVTRRPPTLPSTSRKVRTISSLPYRSQRRGSPARALASRLTRAMPRTDRGAFSVGVDWSQLSSCRCASSPRTACAPGQSQSGSEEAATLRVSTWGNDSRLKLTQQAVGAFTAANPGIKVTVENNDWSADRNKLADDDGGQQRT